MIRILITDRVRLRINLTAALLSREPDMQVIGSADTANDAMEQIAHCDVLLIGNSLPPSDALQLALAATCTTPQIKVIAVGFDAREPLLVALLDAGATGYILPDASVADFLSMIRDVHAGKHTFASQEPSPLRRGRAGERRSLAVRGRAGAG